MKLTVNGIYPKLFTFPDGQPHVDLEGIPVVQDYTIECSIRSAHELLELLLVKNVLDMRGFYGCHLKIAYLMGGRMDRSIDFVTKPFTLEVVASIIRDANFSSIKLFNAHSDVSSSLLQAENMLPRRQIQDIIWAEPTLRYVSPDAGAYKWQYPIYGNSIAQCSKKRDPLTGILHGFSVDEPGKVKGRDCLIIDDICDGGGTFAGLAVKLKEAGAQDIYLYVSHGIFSKGYAIDGIKKIFTTTSYREKYPDEITVFSPF